MWSRLLKPIAAYLWTLAPMYGIERLANYYFLNKDATFYLISGWRLEVFIISVLVGSIAAGAVLRELRVVVVTQSAALASFFFAVYFLCDPRVCYSAAPDGFEALRFGLFIAAVAVAGGGMGIALGGISHGEKCEAALVAGASFYAVAYYPTVFTFAGARLLAPLDPWPTAAVLFFVSMATSMSGRSVLGRGSSIAIPVASLLLLLAASSGIALAYLGSLSVIVTLAVLATLTGASIGEAVGFPKQDVVRPRKHAVPTLFAVAILLVLTMTLAVIPDAVSGVTPGSAAQQAGTLSIGTPVYVGAYQVSPQGHADVAGVTVSFAGSDPAVIREDNYLSAGIGIHSAGCCVDGIDYAYRFDIYLFHSGSASLVASGWEACDDNAACGGHSWKILLLSKSESLGAINLSRSITLQVKWSGGFITWYYSQNGSPHRAFTTYVVPSPENHDFNTGVSGGVSLSSQKAAYFYQFGVMSRYPMGAAGWKVTFGCPYAIFNGTGGCITHAATVRGADSYWKVIWRWGEDYPNVTVSSAGAQSAVFEYSATDTTPSFQSLW